MTKKNDTPAAEDPVAIPIPNPPGGGSWTFDTVQWAWVSNDPAVEPVAPASE